MSLFESQSKEFQQRHIGPDENQTKEMLEAIGINSINELINRTVPSGIRMQHQINLPAAMSDDELNAIVQEEAAKAAAAGATGGKAMGVVVKAVRERVGTGADGSRVSAAVKIALG